MAIERNITADDHWFLGEDKSLSFAIYQSDGLTPQNIVGWDLSWRLKTSKVNADADALLTKTTAISGGITISGSYSADPVANTQRAVVAIADTDTDSITPGTKYHELKRTTAGSETVLTFGAAQLLRGVHRS